MTTRDVYLELFMLLKINLQCICGTKSVQKLGV